jgi:membrane associated rhomboid family serine protease
VLAPFLCPFGKLMKSRLRSWLPSFYPSLSMCVRVTGALFSLVTVLACMAPKSAFFTLFGVTATVRTVTPLFVLYEIREELTNLYHSRRSILPGSNVVVAHSSHIAGALAGLLLWRFGLKRGAGLRGVQSKAIQV